ncbi:MAG: hypothetical protein QM523_09770 [Candidatus Pacebacteria bacterium]|nr:hypothetical protein [Candidatus Paceibacterota bacterium]
MADDYRRPDYDTSLETDHHSSMTVPVQLENLEDDVDDEPQDEFDEQLINEYLAAIAADPELAETVPWEQVRSDLNLAG